MPFVVYSYDNITSKKIGSTIVEAEDFEEVEMIEKFRHFKCDNIDVLEIGGSILATEFLDKIIKTDLIIFVCSHKSSREVASLTAHSEGNWAGEAKLGGKPRELSVAAPLFMHKFIVKLNKNNRTGLPVIYEATHHGPLLRTPSLFVEVGGNKDALESDEYCTFVGQTVIDSVNDNKDDYDAVTFGIGGLHYSEKFTRLAIEKGYAFSHIMPKYYVNELGMLNQGVSRSSPKAEKAVIEWKSIKAVERDTIIKELDSMGMDYERV